MTGDACAFLPEGFLGNLDDDVLTCLEHFGNELRAAYRSVSTLMPAMRAVAMATATATLEAPAATVGTAITTTISSARPIEASPPAAIAATIPSAALRPLETRARIAANARGIPPDKIFAGSVGVAWSAGFPGKKNYVLLDEGFSRFALRGNGIGFGFNTRRKFPGAMPGVMFGSVLRIMLRFSREFMFRIMVQVQIRFRSFDGLLMFAVGVLFGFFASAPGFLMLGLFALFFVEEVLFGVVSFFFLLVEGSATNHGVGLGAGLSFLVLGLHQAGGKSGELFIIQGGKTIVSGWDYGSILGMFLSRSGDRLGRV